MNGMKACPYCGEQILIVAVKCKHCGSMLEGASLMAVVPMVVRSQFSMRPGFLVALVIIVALIAASWAYNWSKTGSPTGNGFSDADVAAIKQSIHAEFGKEHGLRVEDGVLMRESPRKLTGFVKVGVPLLGVMTKSCSATMGDDGQSIWGCGTN